MIILHLKIYDFSERTPLALLATTLVIMGIFSLPTLLIFVYGNIYLMVIRSNDTIVEIRNSSPTAKTENIRFEAKKTLQRQWALARNAIIVILVNSVTWLPFALKVLYTVVTGVQVSDLVYGLFDVLASLNISLINPLMIFVFDLRFQREGKRLIFGVPSQTNTPSDHFIRSGSFGKPIARIERMSTGNAVAEDSESYDL